MTIPEKTVEALLKKSGKADDARIAQFKEQALADHVSLRDLALSTNTITDSELVMLYAEEIGVPFIELNVKELDRDILRQLPEHIAKIYAMVVFDGGPDTPEKSIAMEDPDDLQAIDVLHKLFGNTIRIHMAPHLNILGAIDQYRGNLSGEITKAITQDDTNEEDENVKEEDIAEDSPVAQTVNLILEYAIKSSASDIHIEPRERHVQIRYRIDGVQKKQTNYPSEL